MIETITTIVLLSVTAGLHFFLWRRFVKEVWRAKTVWYDSGTMIVIASWLICSLALVSSPYEAPMALLDTAAYGGKAWLNTLLIMAVALFFIAIGQSVTKKNLSRSIFGSREETSKRKQMTVIFVFITAVALTAVHIAADKRPGQYGPWDIGPVGSLPFSGHWLVGNTPARQVPSHGTDLFAVDYAIDFIAVDERNRTSGTISWRSLLSTEPPEVFYAFGQPVLSPVSGTVMAIHDGEADHCARRSLAALVPYMLGQGLRIRKGIEAIAGNYIIIAPDEADAFIAIVHLQFGSIQVSQGQRVSEGDYLANCGNSGNSTQPHIHIQGMSSMDFTTAAGVPLLFRRYTQWDQNRKRCHTFEEAIPDTNTIISP